MQNGFQYLLGLSTLLWANDSKSNNRCNIARVIFFRNQI